MAKTRHSQSQGQRVTAPRRGEIHLCTFDPTVGHEIRETRPALVIQNNIGNRHSPLTIVAAISSTISAVAFPVEVVIEPGTGNGLEVRSSMRLDQIRTVDRKRLLKRLGKVDTTVMTKVDEAIKISLGLVNV